jgi:hypothetical protein
MRPIRLTLIGFVGLFVALDAGFSARHVAHAATICPIGLCTTGGRPAIVLALAVARFPKEDES